MSEAPEWLLTMRAISGLSEKPGAADEPKIMAMADEIAHIFPEMKSYCDQYNHADADVEVGVISLSPNPSPRTGEGNRRVGFTVVVAAEIGPCDRC